jgi:hypothetical protein
MLKSSLIICLGLSLFLAFSVGPVSAEKNEWKCDADDIEDFNFNGGDYAYIHLSSYSSGDDYSVTFNETKTVATGTTGDGTPFTCSLQNISAPKK